MFNQKSYTFLLFLLLQVFFPVKASYTQMQLDSVSFHKEEADRLAAKLQDIKGALYAYYVQNNAFPASLDAIKTDQFYFGSFNTTYGTAISGVNGVSSYTLSVSTSSESSANYLAGVVDGVASSASVTYQFAAPSQASIINTTLSKVDDGDISRNTMDTTLYMGGNDVRDVKTLYADAVYDSGNRVFSESFLPNASHVGLEKVQNFGISDEYLGGRSDLYVSQNAATKLYNALNAEKLDVGGKAVDADKLDGFDSSDFVKVNTTINGKALTSNITLTSADLGLGNVNNFGISHSYTGNRTNYYASERALTSSYNALNSLKLDKTGKAADANKLDGLDSSAFVQKTRTINGKSLASNITLTKSDFNLGSVNNFGISHSYTGNRTNYYASERAVTAGVNSLKGQINTNKSDISSIESWISACKSNASSSTCGLASIGGRTYTRLYYNGSGLNSGNIYLSSSWRGYNEVVVLWGHDSSGSETGVSRFTEYEYDALKGHRGSSMKFSLINNNYLNWQGYFSSNTTFRTLTENARIHAIYGVK